MTITSAVPCRGVWPAIYLASQSPRRRELLQQLGVEYLALAVEIDESWQQDEEAGAYVSRLAVEKAQAGATLCTHPEMRPVLGADTAVVVDGSVLGKATDTAGAIAMLTRLSGRMHQVYSAVAMLAAEIEVVRLSVTCVWMRPLSGEEIETYCKTSEPLGKAGGYAIQGRAAAFIERIEGSYSGVVGLPLFETAELLLQAGRIQGPAGRGRR